jgi:hypothetical protein
VSEAGERSRGWCSQAVVAVPACQRLSHTRGAWSIAAKVCAVALQFIYCLRAKLIAYTSGCSVLPTQAAAACCPCTGGESGNRLITLITLNNPNNPVSLLLLFALSALCHVSCKFESTGTRAVLPMHACIGYSGWGRVAPFQRLQSSRCATICTGAAELIHLQPPSRSRARRSRARHHHACYLSTGELSAGIAAAGFACTTLSGLFNRRCSTLFHRTFLLQEACCRSKF